MNDWAGGYASDIEYIAAYYGEQAPVRLNHAALLAGWEPRPIAGEFTYCELACGHGITANLLAAAYPKGRFWAVDFNPAHIAFGRSLAAESGLGNVEFLEHSFEELLRPDAPKLPQFDFITLHGIYSWVSPENRRNIVEFLRRHLKSGGIAYVSYNCLPGWSRGLALQRFLFEAAATTRDRSDRRMTHALDLLEKLTKAGARSFAQNHFVDDIWSGVRSRADRYLVHEYLNSEWHPMYSIDVGRELGAAKLDYVGSASLLENFPQFLLTPEQRELVDGIGAPDFRELVRDLCLERRFRRDVYVRGARRLGKLRHEQLLRETRLALVVPREKVHFKLNVPIGEATLAETTYAPIFDALAESPRTVGDLLALPEVRDTTLQAIELCGVLPGSAQAMPIAPLGEATDAAPSLRYNVAVARRNRDEDPFRSIALASPLLGTGLQVNSAELSVYEGLAAGVPRDPKLLAGRVADALAARGEHVIDKDKPLHDRAEAVAFLSDKLATLLQDIVPVWERLRAI